MGRRADKVTSFHSKQVHIDLFFPGFLFQFISQGVEELYVWLLIIGQTCFVVFKRISIWRCSHLQWQEARQGDQHGQGLPSPIDNIPGQTCVFQSIHMLFQLSNYSVILLSKTGYGGLLAFSTSCFCLSILNTMLPFELKESSVHFL